MPEMIGNLDELIGVIHRSARQEELDVVAGAKRRAEQIREKAQQQAEQARHAILESAQREVAAQRRVALAQHKLEMQRQQLTLREQLLDQVWAAAEQELRELTAQPEYSAVLQRLARLASEALGSEPIILASDPLGHQLLTTDRLKEWSRSWGRQVVGAERAAAIWGGVLATDAAGRRRIDVSFANRLALARAERREAIAAVLGLL